MSGYVSMEILIILNTMYKIEKNNNKYRTYLQLAINALLAIKYQNLQGEKISSIKYKGATGASDVS